MVKATASILALTLLSASCSAENACTTGSEFEPPLCSSKYTEVASISITKNAATQPVEKNAEQDCRAFIVTEDALRQYFLNAKTTTANDAHHTLDWSPCYASGSVEFRDGQKATWEINQLRLGAITLSDREQIVLYCPDCNFPPFM